MRLIDSHCHLDDPQFDIDRDKMMARAGDIGICAHVIPAIKAAWWPRIRQLCNSHTRLYPAYGLHPMFMESHQEGDIQNLELWLKREKPVAVGECGLDFFIENPDRTEQIHLFEQQLELALRYRLPVIIHARKAVEETVNILRHFPGITGLLHSFSGSEQQAERLIDLGFLLGFGGPVTYPRAKRLHKLVSRLPLDSLLLETDSPDQPDQAHRGQRNEPAYLGIILQTMSELRGISASSLAEATTNNAERLFGIAC